MTSAHAIVATVASFVVLPAILGNANRMHDKAERAGDKGLAAFYLGCALPEIGVVMWALWGFA